MFSVLFRKYPLFRTAVYAALIAAALGGVSFFTMRRARVPVVSEVSPPVGSPGDTVTISGANFGASRENSFVEIGGSRISSSGYVSWGDGEIRVILPPNVQDGFLFVVTPSGRSRPLFFANEAGIPVVAPPDQRVQLPVLSSVSPSSGPVGSLIVLTGANFGLVRGGSSVVFRAEGSGREIPADERDFDYESWGDGEIRVRIPDGAGTGSVFVRTERGESGGRRVEVAHPAGRKEFPSERVFALRLDEDVDSVDAGLSAGLTLRVPRPVVSSSQPSVTMNSCEPSPVIADFRGTVIHQVELPVSRAEKMRFTQDFVVTCRSVRTEVNPKGVRAGRSPERALFRMATSPDALVQSGDGRVVALAGEIAGRETNPYLVAQAAYEWLVGNCSLMLSPRPSDADPLDLISRKGGDAYDFAVVYTAVLRAAGIPALPVAGVLVDADRTTRPHWWTEFYVEGLGWVPVDAALGAGLPFAPFPDASRDEAEADPRSFYFGNLDDQHVAFSRGWSEIRQSLVNGKVVRRPRSFAFQSIWEESSGGSVNYSSLWNTPIVVGIY